MRWSPAQLNAGLDEVDFAKTCLHPSGSRPHAVSVASEDKPGVGAITVRNTCVPRIPSPHSAPVGGACEVGKEVYGTFKEN